MNEKEFLKRLSPPSDEDLVAGLALVPQHVRDALPRTGECRDRAPRIELYAPWGVGAYAGWRWHVISVDRADDNIAYCRVQGLFDESGAVHLDDIASIRGPRGQRVVRVEGHTQGSTGASSPLPNDLTPSARPQTRSPDRHGREFWQSATVEDALLCIRDEAECDELLLQAASHSPNPSVIEAVCKAGANVQSVDQNEKTALHQAASFNDNPAIISTLTSFGADINARDWEGRTPLHDAAQFAHEPGIIRALIEAGANVNSRANIGQDLDGIASGASPLSLGAGTSDCLDVIRALLDAGAHINQCDAYGQTPLHECTGREDPVELIELFLKAGADLDAETTNGHAPLNTALLAGNTEAYDALISAGAKPNAEMQRWVQEFEKFMESSAYGERPPTVSDD